MDKLELLKQRIDKFNKDRDWDQFHTPSNLAKSISIEANELLECFQWNDTDYDSGEYDLPLCAVRTDEAVQRRGNDREIVARHIQVRGVEVVVDGNELDHQNRSDSRTEHRQDYAEINPGIACAVKYRTLVEGS